MALTNLKTPGVYVQEISVLPGSVAAVPTAVPAFIGYTESGSLNTPVRITSMLDYQAAFGGPFHETFGVTLHSDGTIDVEPTSVSPANVNSPYTLFYHLQMFYANGGGTCYVVSVGHYDLNALTVIDPDLIVGGLEKIEAVDEVTLLVAPETLNAATDADIKKVYDAMLIQCNKLKDRFALMDVKEQAPFVSVSNDADVFRSFNVGANYLNYGAAYYPYLDTVLTRFYSDDDVTITDNRPSPVYNTTPNNRLSTIANGKGGWATFAIQKASTPDAPDANDTLTVTVGGSSAVFYAGIDFPVASEGTNGEIASAIGSAISNHPVMSTLVRVVVNGDNITVIVRSGNNTPFIPEITVTANADDWINPVTSPVATNPGANNSQDTALYNAVKAAIKNINGLTLPPAATMAGIYAAVDNDRGVWKAPANVSVANIVGPDISVTEAQQAGLNVDATSGKSINAIRTFTGRGTLVWGARTLEGNSNEWRYVPVRRLFIFAEESIKKATEFVVFEPNDRNTWIRLKGMISNFLSDLWKQGALAGSKPEQAFFVQVGLGETMTAQDILEGRLIVTIGMAAVRPAEFIILQFTHKLQEA